MFESVEFASQDAVLRGRLYRPLETGSVPAVVMAHGTSATIAMTTDRYAEVFQASGFAVFLYDHRNFGDSSGEPRQEINPWVQARGYCDAITFLESIPDIDRDSIALWGDSYSAAEALIVAAVDGRPAAVIAQVPAFGGQPAPPDPDGSLFSALSETLREGAVEGGPGDRNGPLPVVSADQLGTPSLLKPIQAFRWFIEYGGRHGSGWENRVTRVVPSTRSPFHAGIAAPHLSQPALVMVAPGDEMPAASPDVSRAVYDSVSGPKELVEIDGGHFGLLHHPSDLFDQASRVQSDFLSKAFSCRK
ncbi:MAG: alpha/beta hydrolase [Solirubrobacterales bacterium]